MAVKVIQCFKNAKGNAYVGGVSTMLNAYFESSDEFLSNGCEIELFDYQSSKKHKNSKIANLSYIFEQRRALSKKLSADDDVIVNIHTSRDFLFLKDVFLAAMANKKHNIPIVLTVHVGDVNTVFCRIKSFKRKCVKLINKHIMRVVCLSNHIRDQFIEIGVNPEKCVVLGNFHYLAPIEAKNIAEKKAELNLLFVGAIHREKGIIELLDAVTNLKDLRISLDVCGKITDPSIKNDVESKVEALGARVCMHGYVMGEKKSQLYDNADVLVLPSYHEGFPLVIAEALAFGCGIISTKVGATREILKETENVLWVKVADSKTLEEAIEKLYYDKKLLSTMKSNNKKLGFQYGIDEHIRRLCLIYADVSSIKKREENG